MNWHSLQRELEQTSKKKLKVKINDNRSTMLSVKWEPDCTKVSLHRMFLGAPQNIMEELACYLRRERKIISPSVKAFIENNLQKLDYSHQLDVNNLKSQGTFYNLRHLYHELNQEYFKGKLDLHITWFGKSAQRSRTRVTFGLYHDPLRLIKIHRLLDSPSFPDYVVSYVIYHEMLHHVCPSYVDEKGMNRVHSKEFKAKEQKYRHYGLAQSWIKEHRAFLFE
jgi:hypothetical protein